MSSSGRGRRRPKKHEEEEHENHERWLVSYADMMTLLMVLFIVMFAISQVDQRRFDMLKDGMAAGFGSSSSPFQGSEGTMSAEGIKPLDPMRPEVGTPLPVKDDSQVKQDAAASTPAPRDSVEIAESTTITAPGTVRCRQASSPIAAGAASTSSASAVPSRAVPASSAGTWSIAVAYTA